MNTGKRLTNEKFFTRENFFSMYYYVLSAY